MAACTQIDHPVFARLYDLLAPMEWLLAPHRASLARGLEGRVLDLGAGTGAMIPYVVDGGTDVELYATEPDPNMRRRLEATAADHTVDVQVQDARAESLPYADDSFDTVIAAMVFCTIEQPDIALEEVARVLRPGGELRFLEHVRSDGWRESGQRLLEPVWRRVAGNCHLTRDTVGRFVGHSGFDPLEIERLAFGIFPATPFVRGRLRRRRS